MNKPRLAAIDVGTNSFHLVIVEVESSAGNFKILGREKENVRLGSGSSDMKYISPDAMKRGVETMKRFKALADSANASVRAIATSAVREALNQEEFIRKVKDETGIKVEIASGVEEARYIYLGILQALPVFDKKILLVDIGGGSTEFLVGHQRNVISDNSLKLGAIRITQRFFPNGKTDSKSIKECRKYIAGFMMPVTREIRREKYEQVVGSSGTITNLANIIKVKRGLDVEMRLNNFTFKAEELFEVVEEILSIESPKERTKILGLDQSRADIIAAGGIILEQIFKELKIKEMTISEFALREGVIYDTIERENLVADSYIEDLRRKSVLHIADNFRFEKEHSLHTSFLANRLFDELRPLHKLGENEREYLEAATILHEVGCFVSHTQHHRHSYYLIRNAEMLGFTEDEKEIIANVARYHRKSHPKKDKHSDYAKLSEEDKKIVNKLAAILRVADGLDRTHLSAVKDLKCKIEKDEVTIILKAKNGSDLELDIWGADLKKGLFEEVFGVKLKIKN